MQSAEFAGPGDNSMLGTTPTVEVYNAMLSGCARLGKTREARKVFLSADLAGLSEIVVSVVRLPMCSRQAAAKFREMLDASLQPDVITFNSMTLA